MTLPGERSGLEKTHGLPRALRAVPIDGQQMPERTFSEVPDDLFPIAVIARRWPAKAGGISPGAVFRFANRGRKGVLLRVLDVPGVGLCSCMQWVKEFIATCNPPERTDRSAANSSTPQKPRLRDLVSRRQESRNDSV